MLATLLPGYGKVEVAPGVVRFQNANSLTAISMLPVQRLGHVAIRVRDIDRAICFYTSLGMRVIWKATDWSYLEASNSHDGLALLGPNYQAAGPHFAFHFKDREAVEDVHYKLRQEGTTVGEVHNHRDGTASFYLQDPDGNWLEMLYEPPEGILGNQSKISKSA